MANKGKQKSEEKERKEDLPGYPIYPESEDIYSQAKEETEIDLENPARMKGPAEPADAPSEKNFEDDVTGGDLDIPGADLDDQQEDIGSEDEENNYYSLGGDKD